MRTDTSHSNSNSSPGKSGLIFEERDFPESDEHLGKQTGSSAAHSDSGQIKMKRSAPELRGTGGKDSALTQFFANLDPHSLLPPLEPWRGASESLVVPTDHPWITPAETTGLTDTPGYDESIAWLEKLCSASPHLSLHVFGRSAQGRALYLVVASNTTDHDAESLRADGKPTLLVQAGVHPGEIEGKDAGFMLLRDIAFDRECALLEGANLLFLPVLNPDGHERISIWNRPNQRGPAHMGWRTTAQNLNLNRDYVKADSPEMRALLSVLNQWKIDLYLDIHATDGLDYQYDITYAYHGRLGSPSWSPRISEWIDRSFSPTVDADLRDAGHIPLNIYISPLNKRDFVQGLREWQMSPRLSLGYGDIRHIPTVLIETHSLKPYRQRVLATYIFIESAMRLLGQEADALKSAITADQLQRMTDVPLRWSSGGPRRELDFLGIDFDHYHSPASGVSEVRWLGSPRTYQKLPVFTDRIGLVARRPNAYWVPVTKPEVIRLLKVHGFIFETIASPRTIELEIHRIALPRKPQNFKPEESRQQVTLSGVIHEKRTVTFPAGSVRVSTDQTLGDLAIMMLEPMGSDSLFHWGFFNEILQRTEYIEGYVIAPLAEKMLAHDPALNAEFIEKLATDSAFEADAEARLEWFYQRSPFYDQEFMRYPVGIER